MGGKVVSVTTDGFITDIPDLESKLFNLKSEYIPLLSRFKDLRIALSHDLENQGALELKHQSKGVIS